MNEIVLDIETVINVSDEMKAYLLRNIKPRANLKDSDLIIKDVKEKQDKIFDDAPLDATTGKIILMGISVDGNETYIRKETESLNNLWYWIVSKDIKLITFNGKEFDLPFCIQRSRILGIDVPSVVFYNYLDKYNLHHFDVMREWTLVYKKYITLEKLCIALGIDPPIGSGADIPKLYAEGNMEAIVEHCKSDIRATWGCYQRIKGD